MRIYQTLVSAIPLLLVPLHLFGQSVAFGGEKVDRPNVLIINIDDMGYGDMSCHGNPVFSTPALDKLHDQSIRFTQFHVSPMCTPTRGQLFSGRDALKNGARWVGTENTHLRTDLPILPEVFKEAGYATALFGKWHLGDNYPLRAMDRGFDEVVTFPQQEVGTVNDFWTNDYFDDTYEHNGIRKKYEGYCTDVWFNLAKEWIGEKKDKNEPFFCVIPTNVTHGPHFVDQKYRDRLAHKDLSKLHQTFAGIVLNLDENIGKMMDYLDDRGLSKNTIVIFMTDNGATMGYGLYNAGMRGLKTHLWEGGHRVPLFVRLPQNGNIRSGRDINELAQVQDLFPTLMDLCNIQSHEKIEFDGISLMKQLTEQAPMPDRILVTQFQRRLEIKKYDACIMWGPWRLLNAIDADPKDTPEQKKIYEERKRNYEIKLELYNLVNDPHQDNNVMDQFPGIAKKMKDFYEKWWKSTDNSRSITTPIIVGNEAENPSYLAATSWAETYFTQKSQVLIGRNANGWWNIVVDRDGTYEFTLRRWPRETKTPLSGSIGVTYTDAFPYGPGEEGEALKITQARMKIGKYDEFMDVAPSDEKVTFKVNLKQGPTQLKTWFYDNGGKELCGAYYVEVLKK